MQLLKKTLSRLKKKVKEMETDGKRRHYERQRIFGILKIKKFTNGGVRIVHKKEEEI